MCEKGHHTMYRDPWRGRIRALEKNIIKFRAIQSVLAIYYAEKLKRDIISAVRHCVVRGDRPISIREAVKAWVEKGVITREESNKIRSLIDYRNNLAHEFHRMNTDLSTLRMSPVMDDVKQYDYAVMRQLKATIKLLHERAQSSLEWCIPMGLETLDFETTEHILVSELKALDRKINRLLDKRRMERDRLNHEIKAIREKFSGKKIERPWRLRHENGRLTKTGGALCEEMFDSGHSATAVAYVMEMSITSARSRLRAFLSRNNGRHSQQHSG
ncbi:MAG: hypothetical protein OXD43_05935 [Bacteroidetes bacterium]|nr:hypothetical protein [Bacteroidota bacterium]